MSRQLFVVPDTTVAHSVTITFTVIVLFVGFGAFVVTSPSLSRQSPVALLVVI